jgi:hypothetical protein
MVEPVFIIFFIDALKLIKALSFMIFKIET